MIFRSRPIPNQRLFESKSVRRAFALYFTASNERRCHHQTTGRNSGVSRLRIDRSALTYRVRRGTFVAMSGKELAKQAAALSEPERENFISELLQHEDLVEDLEDILLVGARRNEPSIPFDEVIAGLKRDKLV